MTTKNRTEQTYNEQEEAIETAQAMYQEEYPVKHSTALVPMPHESVSPVVGMAIDPAMSFRQKRALNRQVSKLIDGESESAKKYLNKVIWVAACAQHPVIVNSKTERLNKVTGEVMSPYIDRVRTVLHVVAVDSQKLPETKKLSFTALSIERYFQLRFINVYGMVAEEPVPYIISQNDDNSYNVQEPEEELYFSEMFPG